MLGLHRAVTPRSPRRHDRRRVAAIFRLRFSVQGALRACAYRCQRHSGLFRGLTSPIKAGFTPLHRLKSSKTGNPGAVRAKVSQSPISRQAAHQGLPETSALTTPPKSVWPLPPVQAAGLTPAPQPSRRRPPSHPAARSRSSAASRPDHDCPPQWICLSRRLALRTGHSYDPRKLRVWAVALLHLLRTMDCYLTLPPHDLPQAQHKSRVPAVSRGRRPGSYRSAQITAHCATEDSAACHGCCAGSAPQHPRQASSAFLVPVGGSGVQKSGGQEKDHSATLHYGQVGCVAPKNPSHHSQHASVRQTKSATTGRPAIPAAKIALLSPGTFDLISSRSENRKRKNRRQETLTKYISRSFGCCSLRNGKFRSKDSARRAPPIGARRKRSFEGIPVPVVGRK